MDPTEELGSGRVDHLRDLSAYKETFPIAEPSIKLHRVARW